MKQTDISRRDTLKLARTGLTVIATGVAVARSSGLTYNADQASRSRRGASASIPNADKYTLKITGFALSDGQSDNLGGVKYDEVDVGRWLHIYVDGTVPEGVDTLQGYYRLAPNNGYGDPTTEEGLGTGVRKKNGQFEFFIEHYTFHENLTYFIRVADTFTGDTKCMASAFMKTKK